MSNYTQSTDFTTKDGLATGNPLKLIRGSEVNVEFDNIQASVNSKCDKLTSFTQDNLQEILSGGGADAGIADSELWIPKTCLVRTTTAQSIPNDTWTDITWGSQIHDKFNAWDVGDPDNFITGTDTNYWFQFIVAVEFNEDTQPLVAGVRLQNLTGDFSTDFSFAATTKYGQNDTTNAVDKRVIQLVTPIFQNVSGDNKYKIQAYQKNGASGACDIEKNDEQTWCQIIRWSTQ